MITTTTVEAGGEVAFAGVADVNIRRYDAWRALPGAFRREGRKYTPARGLTVRVAHSNTHLYPTRSRTTCLTANQRGRRRKAE
jgi:hypothetical protein